MCVCVCALMRVLLETNVVLMLMRSHSSLAAVSGIEFLLGNGLHTHKQYILISHSHAPHNDLFTNAFNYALRHSEHRQLDKAKTYSSKGCVLFLNVLAAHTVSLGWHTYVHTHTLRDNSVQLLATSSEIQPSISPNQRPGEQAT